MENLLEVKNLVVTFPIKRGVWGRSAGVVRAVDDVSFTLRRGETLGVVGASGCGKSTTSRAILGFVKPAQGEMLFNGRSLLGSSDLARKERARKIQVVFQDPLSSLNPRHTVREILTEGLLYHKLCTKATSRAQAISILEQVGLSSEALDRYPHEFSGGERQRICIARAIALKPELLICDEAVSALDLSVRAQILDLLAEIKRTHHLSILFITHDLGVVQHVADRILVMAAGRIVERGDVHDVLGHPQAAETKALLASCPHVNLL